MYCVRVRVAPVNRHSWDTVTLAFCRLPRFPLTADDGDRLIYPETCLLFEFDRQKQRPTPAASVLQVKKKIDAWGVLFFSQTRAGELTAVATSLSGKVKELWWKKKYIKPKEFYYHRDDFRFSYFSFQRSFILFLLISRWESRRFANGVLHTTTGHNLRSNKHWLIL